MSEFSEHTVNQRFKTVYDELERLRLIKGKSDIAKHLGTYNHVVNSILKGQRNITVDQLFKLCRLYDVNANYLFGLDEDIFLPGAKIFDTLPTRSLLDRQYSGRQNISMVPGRALAGYALEYQEKDFLEGFPKFSIPGMEGDLIAFEISGDSMLPTITNGDIVVCEPMERGEPLRDNQVYVIVTDVVVAKRIQQIRDSQLLLISDNDAVYKPYEVDIEEIRQMLKVKCRLTAYAIS